MSFFQAIKKSFGFGDDSEDELYADSSDPVQAADSATSGPAVVENGAVSQEPVTFDQAAAERIFERVVETFDEALPSFIRDSVDPAAQRHILYESLDESLREYISSLETEVRHRCESMWAAEQASMRSEMEALRVKTKEVEQQRFDIKQQQLSADRQKRALTDRVHDLESQIASLEAEREQFDLENKSLVNKLKVAGVHENESAELREELNNARAEIARLRADAQSASQSAGSAVDDRLTELEKENESLRESLAALENKDEIGKEMFNDLQRKASEAREELENKQHELDRMQERLTEAESLAGEVDDLARQMARVEEVIEKRDRKIARLKETCEQLRQENASLQQTIARNLKIHADSEAALSERIAELESDPSTPVAASDLMESVEVPSASVDDEDALPKISDGDLAEIEEGFDTSDWMRTDPPQTSSMRTGISESEFGYQAPVRKTTRGDNDAQLSLF